MSSDDAATNPKAAQHASSPQTLRAVAHPARLDLLELLRFDGPLTASECAEHLGLSAKVCSYHLHTLARYGFVEEAGGGKGRARPWQLATTRIAYAYQPDEHDGPDSAANEFARVLLDRDARTIERFIAERHDLDDEWRNVSTMSSNRLLLSPDQLAAFTRDLMSLLDRYDKVAAATADASPPDARPVRVALYAVPDTGAHTTSDQRTENSR